MAAKRHVTPEEARLAHRLQHTYEHLSAPEWGPNMQKRRAQHAKEQALQAQASNTIRNAARREKKRVFTEFGSGSSSSNLNRSRVSSDSAMISGSRSSLVSKSVDSLKPGALLLKTGSYASVQGVSTTADVWSERAKALRDTSRVHQGMWSEGLSTPLPMIRAGVPGIQRG